MISVISVNYKFLPVSSTDLIKRILDSKTVRGIEYCIDIDNEETTKYMMELVESCREYNLLFQVHGDSSIDIEKQKRTIDKLIDISDYLGYPINIVLHPLSGDSVEEEVADSEAYFKEVLEYADLSKVRISVENLNDGYDNIRLDKEEMKPILYNDERLYMTYDIGHDIADFGKITDIDPLFIKRISNIHIHSIDPRWYDGYDHKPVDDETEQFEQVLKGILFLINNEYEGPVVFEYDIYSCRGETLSDQLDGYIHSIDDTSEHFI